MLLVIQIAIFGLIFGAVGLLGSQIIPIVIGIMHKAQEKRVRHTERQLDKMFIEIRQEKLFALYALSPVVTGIAAFVLIHNFAIAFIAAAFGGLGIPTIVLRSMSAQRKMRFNNQLLDGIMVLSSSLKGGLSLIQAIEVLVEEMPPPISQEFGLILRENKMGVTLEDSFERLNRRLKIEELSLLINSILVARETGGDLTKVLARLSNTIRDNKKLKDNVKTLTLQGRMQGIIMSFLPLLFIWWILTFNREHFDIMLKTDTGRTMLFVAAVLQVIGMFLIKKFSTVRI